jgi:hypothetical protein
MTMFVFEGTLREPGALRPDSRDRFRSALEAAGASDPRVNEDEEGRVTVSFRLDATTEREAMEGGSELALSSLEGHSAPLAHERGFVLAGRVNRPSHLHVFARRARGVRAPPTEKRHPVGVAIGCSLICLKLLRAEETFC